MTADQTTRDRAERADVLLRSLRDLEAERLAGEISEDDYTRLRDRYTAMAAAALRSPDAPAARPRPDRAGELSSPSRRRRVRAGLGGLVIAGVAILAGVAVSSSAGERVTGEQVSGSVAEGPNDKIARAQQLVSAGKVVDAVQLYDEVLADDPEHPVALAQRGWLVSRAGLHDDALAYVDRAIRSDPRYLEAHFFRAMILRDKGDTAGAVSAFQTVLSLGPPAGLRTYVEDAIRELEGSPSAEGP